MRAPLKIAQKHWHWVLVHFRFWFYARLNWILYHMQNETNLLNWKSILATIIRWFNTFDMRISTIYDTKSFNAKWNTKLIVRFHKILYDVPNLCLALIYTLISWWIWCRNPKTLNWKKLHSKNQWKMPSNLDYLSEDKNWTAFYWLMLLTQCRTRAILRNFFYYFRWEMRGFWLNFIFCAFNAHFYIVVHLLHN